MQASLLRWTLALGGAVLLAGGTAAQQPQMAAVHAGRLHTCALDGEGKAWCWGANEAGQLGARGADQCILADGVAECRRTPAPVETQLRFTSIVAGDWHTCALDGEGRAWCWGRNDAGQLGTDTVPERCVKGKPCSFVPLAVRTGLRFKRLAIGSFHTCGITTADRIACWGLNQLGQLGSDSAVVSCAIQVEGRTLGMVPCRAAPVAVAHGVGWLEVGAASRATCGRDVRGEVYCWGLQVGDDGSHVISPSPERIPAPDGTHDLAVGDQRALVLSAEQFPLEWGRVELGKEGVTRTAEFPANLADARKNGPTFIAVTAGVGHRCGVTMGGEAYCWGENENGQLGTGGTGRIRLRAKDRWRPGKVLGGLQVKAITAGGFHTCALTRQGGVACWGSNQLGQLGIGTTDKRRTEPVPVVLPAVRLATP